MTSAVVSRALYPLRVAVCLAATLSIISGEVDAAAARRTCTMTVPGTFCSSRTPCAPLLGAQCQSWSCVCPTGSCVVDGKCISTMPASDTINATACDVYVSSVNGSDSDSCGSIDSSCASLQQGINRAGARNTICVHEGIYGCANGWAGRVKSSLMLRGFGAVIDCGGKAGAFRVSPEADDVTKMIEEVRIVGFTVRNTLGNTSNGGYAGGVDALHVRNISISSSSFYNSLGREAGAIVVHATMRRGQDQGNVGFHRAFHNLVIVGCVGGFNSTREKPTHPYYAYGAAAGAISVSFFSDFIGYPSFPVSSAQGFENNTIVISAVQIEDSTNPPWRPVYFGEWSPEGGAAGAIAISFHESGANNNGIRRNTLTMKNVHVRNSWGGSTDANNGGGAGAISVSYFSSGGDIADNTNDLSDLIISNSCFGSGYYVPQGSGAVVLSSVIRANVARERKFIINNNNSISNLTIYNSSGGRLAYTGPFSGIYNYSGIDNYAKSGSISLTLHSGYGYTQNNTNTMSNIRIIQSGQGVLQSRRDNLWNWRKMASGYGAAGSILVHFGGNMHIANTVIISSCQISNSSGGYFSTFGSAAGAIAITYSADLQRNANNMNTISDLTIRNSSGGRSVLHGAAAGSLAISFHSQLGSRNNTNILSNCQIEDSTGGEDGGRSGGGVAGAIAITFNSYSPGTTNSENDDNINIVRDSRIQDSSGGRGSTNGGTAGAMVISFYSSSASNNALDMSGMLVTNVSGGTEAFNGGSAGAISISYFSTSGSSLNIGNRHTFSNMTIDGCSGGSESQGAGALAVQSFGLTNGLSVLVKNATFTNNTGAASKPNQMTGGAAGAVRVFATPRQNAAPNHVKVVSTVFSLNVLAASCTTGLCLAGAVAVSGAELNLSKCQFDDNTVPRGAGALYADLHVSIQDSSFNSKSLPSTRTCDVQELSVVNSSMHFVNFVPGLVSSALTSDQLRLWCPAGAPTVLRSASHVPAGAQIDNSSGTQTCMPCSGGSYSLAAGEWVDGSAAGCNECPSLDPAIVECKGNYVRSQPGYYAYYAAESRRSSSNTLGVLACPNRAACSGLGNLTNVCDARSECNNNNNTGDKCDNGYTGVLCAICQDGWFATKLDALNCKTCPNATASLILYILSTIVLYGVGVILGRKTVDSAAVIAPARAEEDKTEAPPETESDGRLEHMKKMTRKLKHSRNLNIVSSSFKILMVHATVLSAVINVRWWGEAAVHDSLAPATAPSGSVFAFDLKCMFDLSFEGEVYFYMFVPAVMAGCVATMVFLLSKVYQTEHGLSNTAWQFATVGIYTFGAKMISDLFVAFPCYSGVDSQMMLHNPSTVCYSQTTLTVLASIAIIVYTAVAAYVLGFAFWLQKDIIQNPTLHHESELERTYRSFGFLFYDYEPRFFNWEMLVFSRKLLVLVISIWFPVVSSINTRILCLNFIVSLSLVLPPSYCRKADTMGQVLTARFRPYLQSEADTLDIVTQLGTLMSTVLAQYVSSSYYTSKDETYRAVATIAFVTLNLALLIVHISLIGRPLLDKLKESIASLKERFCSKGAVGKAETDSEMLEDSAMLGLEPSLVKFNCSDEGDGTPSVVIFSVPEARARMMTN